MTFAGKSIAMAALAVLAAGACVVGRSPETCPEMEATYVPAGLDQRERSLEGEGSPGVLVRFRDPTGERELSLLSGVAFEGEGSDGTGQIVSVRGHEAEIRVGEPATRYVRWVEGSVDEPCHDYAVIGIGIEAEEFDRVLMGIR